MIKDMNMRKIAMQKELTGNNPQQMLSAEEITTIKTFYHPDSTRQETEHKSKNQHTRRVNIRLRGLFHK